MNADDVDYDDEPEDDDEAAAGYVKWLAAMAPKKKRGGDTSRTVNIGTRTTNVYQRHYSVFGGRRDGRNW